MSPSSPAEAMLGRSHVAFVDSTLPDYKALVAGLKPGTEVHILAPDENEITQISQVLADRTGIKSLAIITHGSEASLELGSTRLNSATLSEYEEDLQGWAKSLSEGGDLLFYGCNVAAGEAGKAFVQQLHQVTGADVAASDDLTGSTLAGGNWELEYQVGKVESVGQLQPEQDYNHVLATSKQDNAALSRLVLKAVRQAKFDQVIDFGPVEDVFGPSPASRIAHTPNVDVAVIELDRNGKAKAVADVLLSRDYSKGLSVPINQNSGTDAVRWRKWDIDRWNGGTFDDSGTQLTTKGWDTNPPFTAADDIVSGRRNAPYQFMSPYPASLFKLLVAYYVMDLVDEGKLSLNQRYTYSVTGETRSIRRWMNPMITYSDNPSTRALVKLLHDRNEIRGMNAEFRRLGLGTLQVNGTDPTTGGNWQPGQIHMTALDTARLLWLINGTSNDEQVLWDKPNGKPVTSAELSDGSRNFLKRLLANQGFNEVLSTSNFGTFRKNGKLFGAPNTRPGIPAVVPKQWIDSKDGTVTVDGIPYGQDVRPFNKEAAEVKFLHKTGLTFNYGSDAGIVQSLPGKPERQYIIAFLANLGYRYADPVFADRTSYPYLDPVGGIAYTQKIPALGKQIDGGIKAQNR
ncbi:DUF4347 domain-containing protein [Leptolyngbya ohadii]|uniref:DUF4347 domain-containing protein n=1 Tax=Leptolyngbya ohadii TaxID=1962290 RepID=UPI000B5998B2|nr:DUF4347 domain-containing protein [Leptolyngbya ohadii]